MGFLSKAANRVRDALVGDPKTVELLKGIEKSAVSSWNSGWLDVYGYNALERQLRLDYDILSRYEDYEAMDDYPEISAALTIYADDATQPGDTGHTVWAESKDEKIRDLLNDLFHRRLRLDEEAWEIARSTAKYGNNYEEILLAEEGVVGLHHLPPAPMRRVESDRGYLYGFLQDTGSKSAAQDVDVEEFKGLLAERLASKDTQKDPLAAPTRGMGSVRIPFEPWEVVHFRLRGKYRQSRYGYSIMESARWIWRRLMLLEDSALIFRVQRAPERYAFYIDVGDSPTREALAKVNRIRQSYRKKRVIDPSTGKINMRYNALSSDEDFWIPVRKDKDGTRIEVLGTPSWQHMEDIDYFLGKLFAAMLVPKAYLAQDDSTARAVLSSEDVRFARSVLRLQKELIHGWDKAARVDLAAHKIDPKSADFAPKMEVPSHIYDLARIEVMNAKADLASRMGDFVSMHWVMSHVFGMSDSEIEAIRKEKKKEKMGDAETAAEIQKKTGIEGFGFESLAFSDDALSEGTGKSDDEMRELLNMVLDQDAALERKLVETQGLVKDLLRLAGAKR